MALSENIRVGLIGLLGVLIGTGAGSIVTWQTTRVSAVSQARQASEDFLRTERRVAYSDFLTKATLARDSLAQQPAALEREPEAACAYQVDLSDKYDAMSASYDLVSIIGSPGVVKAAADVLGGFDIHVKPAACAVPGRTASVQLIRPSASGLLESFDDFKANARRDLGAS